MERAQVGLVKAVPKSKVIMGNGQPPIPGRGEVHLWSWLLADDARTLAALEGTLSDDEWRRVRRIRSHSDARRFISRRGTVRQILGGYPELDANKLRFRYGRQGKPVLAPSLASSLSFNLADSGELAVLAVCIRHPIGVDVERIRPCSDAAEMAASVLALSENEQAKTKPPSDETEAFFRSWTRKEAVSKAEGSGLQFLSKALTPSPAAPVVRPAKNHLDEEPSRWHVYPLPLPSGYAGALAASREIETIICFPRSPDLVPASDR